MTAASLGARIGQYGVQRSLLSVEVRSRLDSGQTREDLALTDVIAFLHIDGDDRGRALRICSYVDVIPGLYLTGGGHKGGQIGVCDATRSAP